MITSNERNAWILLGKKTPPNLKIIIEDESVDGVFKSYHILALARHGDTAVLCVRKSLLFYFGLPVSLRGVAHRFRSEFWE